MAKTLTLSGPPRMQVALCSALREYAEAAYPPGCSECGQVARVALMDAAGQLESGFAATGIQADVSRRLRAHMKVAVQFYCEQHDLPDLLACMEKFISGSPIDAQQLESGCSE